MEPEKKTTTGKRKDCLCQLFKDKDGCYSLREIAIALFIIAMLTSWLGKQFFDRTIPEFMFYSFASLIGAGCFGYSIERKMGQAAETDKERSGEQSLVNN